MSETRTHRKLPHKDTDRQIRYLRALQVSGLLESVARTHAYLLTPNYIPPSITRPDDIFNWFPTTPGFRVLFQDAIAHYTEPHTAVEQAELEKRFAGRAFQDIAHGVLQVKLLDRGLLSGYANSLEAHEIMYPDKRRVENGLGVPSLEGITVADDFLIGTVRGHPQITASVEYTTDPTNTKVNTAYRAFQIAKRRYGRLFSECHSLVVCAPFEPGFEDRSHAPEVSFESVVFNHTEFWDFVRAAHHTRYPFYHATLQEVQEEAREGVRNQLKNSSR